jgi:hypothetical protein
VIVGTGYDLTDGAGEASRVGLPPWPDVVHVLAEQTPRSVRSGQSTASSSWTSTPACGATGCRQGDPGQAEPRPDSRALGYRTIIEPNAWAADVLR